MSVIRNIYKITIVFLLLICASNVAKAQRWAISTNVLTWANLGTINAEGSVSAGRHFTFNTGFTVNPWEISTPTYIDIMNKQYGGYVGVKYWPWHVYSEWWIGAKVQYKNFEQVGLFTSEPVKGDAFGPGLSAGYSLMIGRHVNLDFGLGLWGGRIVNQRNFFFLDNIMVSLVYIF